MKGVTRLGAGLTAVLVVIFAGRAVLSARPVEPVVVEAPRVDMAGAAVSLDTAIFAGGCFWGVEAVFEHLKGVMNAESGYSGGSIPNPPYALVGTGMTGHAEAVRVVFDPAQISYGTLLRVFFSVAHDPTQLNRQGPDVGTQYRSAIFYRNADQRRVASEYIAQLTRSRAFQRPIVTEVAPLKAFYPAEDYHQDYMEHHPDQPYIVYNDAPKLEHLKRAFPELYATPRRLTAR